MGKCQGKLALEETLCWLQVTIATRSLMGEVKLVAPVKWLERLAHTHTTHHTHKLRLIETFTGSHKPSMAPVNPKVRSDPNWGRG